MYSNNSEKSKGDSDLWTFFLGGYFKLLFVIIATNYLFCGNLSKLL
jgi:hypothetical protein